MRLISLDLELNNLNNNPKIIEIGAVCFQPDTGKIVETFQTFVNPLEQITEEITQLTGIKQSDVTGVPTIKEAAAMVEQFKIKYQINAIGITWGGAGSKSNDISKIFEEANVENPFAKRIIDVKSVYQMLANVSNADMRAKVGLGRALNNVGLGWDLTHGQPHSALGDAYNTMRIYLYLSKCLKGGHDIKKS